MNAEMAQLGTRLALAEMIRSGTTCFADMYYFEDLVAGVCKEAGIRAMLCEGMVDFSTPNCKTPEEGLQYTENLLVKYNDDELISIGVAPHALYSCSKDLLKSAKKLADKYNSLLHIHIAETAWENEELKKAKGLSPGEYLYDLGFFESKLLAAHAIYLSEKDMNMFAEYNTGIAHNPQCNMKLASGIAPIPLYLEKGINVGIGTDGVVSNNDLDMVDEMRTAAFLHKVHNNDPAVISAKKALELSTIDGAKVLGLDQQTGSLETGKKADLIIVDLNKPHMVPVFNNYSNIVYCMKSSDVETSIINGKIVMENYKLLTIDEKRLIHEVKEAAKNIRL